MFTLVNPDDDSTFGFLMEGYSPESKPVNLTAIKDAILIDPCSMLIATHPETNENINMRDFIEGLFNQVLPKVLEELKLDKTESTYSEPVVRRCFEKIFPILMKFDVLKKVSIERAFGKLFPNARQMPQLLDQ